MTVDFEPDCPPYLGATYRGITEGAPALLALFEKRGVRATYFATSEVADLYPGSIDALLGSGHELGSHGMTHTAFDTMSPERARDEIDGSATTLRRFAPVVSFRAPYLRFPDRYVPYLGEAGFRIDSSTALYKVSRFTRATSSGITRVPASVTSSILRLPASIRDPLLLSLRDPVVLFVHPWEFVDLRNERLRIDCRFRTGEAALRALDEVLALFQSRGASFALMRELSAA